MGEIKKNNSAISFIELEQKEIIPPKIRSENIVHSTKKKKRVSLKVSKFNKNVLFRKHVQAGYSAWEAHDKVKKFCDFQKNLSVELKNQRKEEIDINTNLKQNFDELCMKLDAERVDKGIVGSCFKLKKKLGRRK